MPEGEEVALDSRPSDALAIAERDGEALTDALHPLQSAGGSIGATWLSAHAARLERVCRQHDFDLVEELWQAGAERRDASLDAMREALAQLRRVGGVEVPREFVFMDRAALGLGSTLSWVGFLTRWL